MRRCLGSDNILYICWIYDIHLELKYRYPWENKTSGVNTGYFSLSYLGWIWHSESGDEGKENIVEVGTFEEWMWRSHFKGIQCLQQSPFSFVLDVLMWGLLKTPKENVAYHFVGSKRFVWQDTCVLPKFRNYAKTQNQVQTFADAHTFSMFRYTTKCW